MRSLPRDFEVRTARAGTTGTLTLVGELDIATLPRLEAAVRELGALPPRLVVDLRALRFLDSMGLEFFLTLDADARADGREVVLVRGPRAVDRLFTVMELESVLQLVDEPPA